MTDIFDENERYTNIAQDIENDVRTALEPIYVKWCDQYGLSKRQVCYLIGNTNAEIQLARLLFPSLRTQFINDPKMPLTDQQFDQLLNQFALEGNEFYTRLLINTRPESEEQDLWGLWKQMEKNHRKRFRDALRNRFGDTP